MKIRYSQKILGLFIIIFLVVLAANIVVGRMNIGQIDNLNNKIRQVTLSAEERERVLAIKDSLLNSEADRKILDKHFIGPSDSDTADFIGYIEGLAKQNNLAYSVKDISHQPISEISGSEQVNFMSFRLNVLGTWDNVFTFLQFIENIPKVVSVANISIDNGPSLGGKTKNWSADFEFSVGRLKN